MEQFDADDIRRLKRLAEREKEILETTRRDQSAAAAWRYFRTLLAWIASIGGAATAVYTAWDLIGGKFK